jgi:2-keto-4-pentenoate hydratase
MAGLAQVRGYTLAFASAASRRRTAADRPVFGLLTADQCHPAYAPIPAGRFVRPRVGVGLAFVLGRALTGPGVLGPDAARAVECVLPVLVILDVDDTADDAQSDTASSGRALSAVVLGDPRTLAPADLRLAGCLLHRNGTLAETGACGALLGSPIEALARLANEAAQRGRPLEPGHLAVLGSITPTVPAEPGDSVAATVSGLGTVAAVLAAGRDGTEGRR